MASQKTITLADDVYQRAQHQAEVEGKTVDELTTEAVQRHLARRTLERFRGDADERRGNKTEAEVEAIVEKAMREYRNENRSR